MSLHGTSGEQDGGGKRPEPEPSGGPGGGEVAELRRRLQVAERQFRAIIQKTADGILVVEDEGGEIRFANEASGRLFGRDPDTLVGSPFGFPMVVGETTEIDLFREGEHRIAELRVVETEWEGEPARIVSLRDITSRKRSEQGERELVREQVARAEAEDAAERAEFLAEAARRLSESLTIDAPVQSVIELLVDSFSDYCMLDLIEDSGVRRFAAMAEGQNGGTVEDLTRHPVDFDGDTPQARTFRERRPQLIESVEQSWLAAAAQDGEHQALLERLAPRSVIMVPLDAGRDCLGLLLAVRTREQAFRSRDLHLAAELGRHIALAIDNARLYQGAEAANQAKADFLSVMSHELRTPLSAILGYTDLLDLGVLGDVSEQQSHYLGRIRASSNHLLQIIEEILSFAGTEAGKDEVHPEAITLGELMEGVRALAEPLAVESSVELRIEVRNDDLKLKTDVRKVRQILLNLISNGVKFTAEGSVVLRAGPRGGDRVRFEVEDTGAGIPADKQEAIFEQFWQLEEALTRRSGGTGLGLTVARSFASLLGGTLEVESQLGVGSTFTLELPRTVET